MEWLNWSLQAIKNKTRIQNKSQSLFTEWLNPHIYRTEPFTVSLPFCLTPQLKCLKIPMSVKYLCDVVPVLVFKTLGWPPSTDSMGVLCWLVGVAPLGTWHPDYAFCLAPWIAFLCLHILLCTIVVFPYIILHSFITYCVSLLLSLTLFSCFLTYYHCFPMLFVSYY